MSNAKVTYNGITLIDLTSDTVTAASLLSGVVAHGSDGSIITGTIAEKSSADIIVSGALVSIPSGYYNAASTTIAAGSFSVLPVATTPRVGNVSLNSSTGVITVARSSQVWENVIQANTIQAGYISADTSSTNNLTIGASSTTYALSTLSATTYTPSTVTQTIAAGKYLTGAQTIAGDTNLVAENIMAGVSIFGVVGTASGGGSYSSLSSSEIYGAAMSGWNVAEPTYGTLMWQAVASGWDVSATMSDNQIEMAVEQGWR